MFTYIRDDNMFLGLWLVLCMELYFVDMHYLCGIDVRGQSTVDLLTNKVNKKFWVPITSP